jgi:hypothetical protein
MTTAKTLALTAGLAGAITLGALAVPKVMNRDAATTDALVAAAAEPATAPSVVDRVPVHRRAPRVVKTALLPASAPELHDRLKPVLSRGTRMEIAAEGFSSAEQFATVAYAARNTDVPFMVLKHRVLDQGKTLAAAIVESKPGINAAAEVVRARAEARQDIRSISSIVS